MPTYSGVVREVGGPELGKSGNEKPRKIVISDSPDYQGKTFRIWSNDSDFDVLSQSLGKHITVEYEAEPIEMGGKKWTSNRITGVQQNGDGGGERTGAVGEVAPAPQPSPSPTDWSVPKDPPPLEWQETKSKISGKDDYWEQRAVMDEHRSLEMEAAWAVKAVLDVEGPNAGSMTDDQIIDKALHLAILKRRIASEMAD